MGRNKLRLISSVEMSDLLHLNLRTITMNDPKALGLRCGMQTEPWGVKAVLRKRDLGHRCLGR